jgi:hypothetical protein
VRLACLAIFGALVLGPGCASQDDHTVGRPMEGEDTPRCYQRARFLEERGIEAFDKGSETQDLDRRKLKYDEALSYFRQARTLYEEELLSDATATPERRATCEREIDRLDTLIQRTHRARPAS